MKYDFIGWCKEGIHDKVWGVINLDDGPSFTFKQVLTFWGRRGSKLQTKMVMNDWALTKLIDSKRNKGYVQIDPARLDEVYPEFQTDLEKTALWQMLKI